MELEGIVAIVTGGASGLGEATTRSLMDGGARVAIWDLNGERGEALASEMGALFCLVNVAEEESVINGLERVQRELESPRVLVNCAGIGPAEKIVGRRGPHRLETFEKVIQVNLVGTFNTIRLVAAAMVELDPLEDGERGVIVNTASVAAYEGQVGQTAYSASKGGIVGMTLPIARDLADVGVRCNTIAPGIFKTPMVEGMPDKVQEALGDMVPFPRRLGQPPEYASLVREICRNRMINGTVIRLDGAIRMQPR